MSLAINLAVLAEGATFDSRGSLTLVAVNPQTLVAEQFPAQFAPIFVVTVGEDVEGDTYKVIVPGHGVKSRVQATDPDGNVVFYTQLQQVVPPVPHPNLPPRVQLIAQVPFAAQKGGEYKVSGRIEVTSADGQEETVEAERKVLVVDLATLRGGTS